MRFKEANKRKEQLLVAPSPKRLRTVNSSTSEMREAAISNGLQDICCIGGAAKRMASQL